MSYDQAPYWFWPLDRWKLLLTIVLVLLLLLVAAIEQPLTVTVAAPVMENPLPGQNFTEGESVTISGTADPGQVVYLLLCDADNAGSPDCDEESVDTLAEISADATGNWQITAPPFAPGQHAVVAATEPDDSGQRWTSSVVAFQIISPPPAVIAPSFDSPDRELPLTQRFELTGQASPGNAVFLFEGTEFLGRTYADSEGMWRFEAPTLDVGTHFLVAKVLAPNGVTLGTSEPLIVLVLPES